MTVYAQFWLYSCYGRIKERHISSLVMKLVCVRDKLRAQMQDLKVGVYNLQKKFSEKLIVLFIVPMFQAIFKPLKQLFTCIDFDAYFKALSKTTVIKCFA